MTYKLYSKHSWSKCPWPMIPHYASLQCNYWTVIQSLETNKQKAHKSQQLTITAKQHLLCLLKSYLRIVAHRIYSDFLQEFIKLCMFLLLLLKILWMFWKSKIRKATHNLQLYSNRGLAVQFLWLLNFRNFPFGLNIIITIYANVCLYYIYKIYNTSFNNDQLNLKKLALSKTCVVQQVELIQVLD